MENGGFSRPASESCGGYITVQEAAASFILSEKKAEPRMSTAHLISW